jgi:hypothetical protein
MCTRGHKTIWSRALTGKRALNCSFVILAHIILVSSVWSSCDDAEIDLNSDQAIREEKSGPPLLQRCYQIPITTMSNATLLQPTPAFIFWDSQHSPQTPLKLINPAVPSTLPPDCLGPTVPFYQPTGFIDPLSPPDDLELEYESADSPVVSSSI